MSCFPVVTFSRSFSRSQIPWTSHAQSGCDCNFIPKEQMIQGEDDSRPVSVEEIRMSRSVAVAFAVLVVLGPLTASCQSYDDTISVSDWRIDGGLQASCPDKNNPTTGWQGET